MFIPIFALLVLNQIQQSLVNPEMRDAAIRLEAKISSTGGAGAVLLISRPDRTHLSYAFLPRGNWPVTLFGETQPFAPASQPKIKFIKPRPSKSDPVSPIVFTEVIPEETTGIKLKFDPKDLNSESREVVVPPVGQSSVIIEFYSPAKIFAR